MQAYTRLSLFTVCIPGYFHLQCAHQAITATTAATGVTAVKRRPASEAAPATTPSVKPDGSTLDVQFVMTVGDASLVNLLTRRVARKSIN